MLVQHNFLDKIICKRTFYWILESSRLDMYLANSIERYCNNTPQRLIMDIDESIEDLSYTIQSYNRTKVVLTVNYTNELFKITHNNKLQDLGHNVEIIEPLTFNEQIGSKYSNSISFTSIFGNNNVDETKDVLL